MLPTSSSSIISGTVPATNPAMPCPICNIVHAGQCPRVKAKEYFPDGTLKRIEFFEPYNPSLAPPQMPQVPYMPQYQFPPFQPIFTHSGIGDFELQKAKL
jgi:hypothetical protein